MNKEILRLAVPSILANITIPLVGLVDMAIVGHLSDASAIGGIAVGTMLFDLLYWNFSFLRVGTSGLTAQAFGAEDRHEQAKLLSSSIEIALIGAGVIWLLQWCFVSVALMCVPCSEEVAEFARRYFYIRVWAAPATLSLSAFKGWFIGRQDTISAMVTDIVVNVVNMGMSYYLSVYTSLGIMGVAFGTVVAQYSGLISACLLAAIRHKKVFVGEKFSLLIRDHNGIKRMLKLNGNLFVRSLCFMVVYVGFTALASGYGDSPLAAAGIMMKLFMLVSYLVDGFAYAGEAMVGRFFGENNILNVHRTVRLLTVWSLGVGALLTILAIGYGFTAYRWMTTDTNVLTLLQYLHPWLIAMPLVSTLAFMWDGIYTGATAGVPIRNSMIWAAGLAALGYVVVAPMWDINALFVAYFIHLIVRVLYLSVRWKKVIGEG